MNLAWNQHIFPMDENGDVPYEGLSERAREMLVPAHNRSSVRRGRPRRGKKKS